MLCSLNSQRIHGPLRRARDSFKAVGCPGQHWPKPGPKPERSLSGEGDYALSNLFHIPAPSKDSLRKFCVN